MADNFAFELVSPETLLVSGEAEIATIPASEGDMGVMANHSPVMTSLRPGFVGVKMGDGSENSYFVRGGFADITPESVTVLAEYAIAKSDMTSDMWDEQIASAKAAMDAETDDAKKSATQTYVQQLETLKASA